MFRIGDFSRLCMIPTSALRYYDEQGLFKPIQVDPFTGYRYYSAMQLPRLNRLLALKDMGLSLEQIARLLDEDLTPEQIRGMLKIKQVELQQQVKDGQKRLARIEVWLAQFEQENKMSNYAVVIKKVAPLRVAEIRDVAPSMDLIGPTLNRLFDEVLDYIHANGARPSAAAVTTYYNMGSNHQNVEVGAGMPYEGANLAGNGRIKITELAGVEQMASVIHNGAFSGLPMAYEAIMKWIEANGYQISGPSRELNLEYERDGDQSKYVTEIQFPVAKG